MTLKESEILKTHSVVAGETLENISFDAFQNGDFWKEIATENNLDIFASDLEVGSDLLIPTLDVINQRLESLELDGVLPDSEFDLSDISTNLNAQGLISWVL